MNVMTVDKPSARVHTLSHISEITLERNPSSVMNVKKPFGSIHILPNTRDSMVNVGNPSVSTYLFFNIRDCLLKRNLNVQKPALLTWTLLNNREFIRKKKLMNVLNVEKLSREVQINSALDNSYWRETL